VRRWFGWPLRSPHAHVRQPSLRCR